MKKLLLIMPLYLSAALCMADDSDPAPKAAAAPASAAASTPVVATASAPAAKGAPITQTGADSNDKSAPAADGAAGAARFVTEAKWETAGYNNDEIVYTILVTSHDTRIIRCTTELKGSYFENGQKLSVSDRQNSTIFPDQQVQVGNWMGMDEKSGATYSVKCHPI
jgi:hypothetical protein